MKNDDKTRAFARNTELGQAEIKDGRFCDVDEFLAELEQEDDCRGESSRI
ncbi:hypothetical protein [Caballeronia arvi]|nr:hypothetical protein [Caballeronia arvi]